MLVKTQQTLENYQCSNYKDAKIMSFNNLANIAKIDTKTL